MTRRLAGVCAIVVALGPGATSAAEPTLESVLDGFDEVQRSIRTLSADFRETTTTPLLVDAIAAQGRFYMTKPAALRWEYTRPEEMRFVIADDLYTGYFPQQRRAERRNIQRWREHIFRFFGLGQASDELGQFYDIRLDREHNQVPGTHLLILEPKRKRVRRRVEEAWFWLDASTYLPVRVEYRGTAGQRRLIEFQDIRLNPELAASLYRMEIPEGVKVSNGFSGLPHFQPDTTQ